MSDFGRIGSNPSVSKDRADYSPSCLLHMLRKFFDILQIFSHTSRTLAYKIYSTVGISSARKSSSWPALTSLKKKKIQGTGCLRARLYRQEALVSLGSRAASYHPQAFVAV